MVGPESAGSHPGPVCYRKQGHLAVTDANVMLGRIQPHLFPAIFGPTETEMLDVVAVIDAFKALTEEVNAGIRDSGGAKIYSVDEVAYGFIRVANEAMARPIRNLTTMKGFDVTMHALACFGGAGPQHCCAIARILGMKTVYINKYSGILSAYGLSLADEVLERQQPCSAKSIESEGIVATAKEGLRVMDEECVAELLKQGYSRTSITSQQYFNCRYAGTDTAIMILVDANTSAELCRSAFKAQYVREFGFDLINREILLDDIRVRVVGNANSSASAASIEVKAADGEAPVLESVSVYFEGGRCSTPVYKFLDLKPGHSISGPAIIIQNVATIVVEPGCTAHVTGSGDLRVDVPALTFKSIGEELDPVYLSVFSHRFMSIAEQMVNHGDECTSAFHLKIYNFVYSFTRGGRFKGHQSV